MSDQSQTPVGRALPGSPRGPDKVRATDLSVKQIGNGHYRISSGDEHHLAWAAGPPTARWVFFDGQVYLVNVQAASGDAPSRGAHDDAELASPMPATVSAVNVTPGQDVARGDVLIMLEAMKMELPIVAPRDGRVRLVACARGELVQPGVPLVELE